MRWTWRRGVGGGGGGGGLWCQWSGGQEGRLPVGQVQVLGHSVYNVQVTAEPSIRDRGSGVCPSAAVSPTLTLTPWQSGMVVAPSRFQCTGLLVVGTDRYLLQGTGLGSLREGVELKAVIDYPLSLALSLPPPPPSSLSLCTFWDVLRRDINYVKSLMCSHAFAH